MDSKAKFVDRRSKGVAPLLPTDSGKEVMSLLLTSWCDASYQKPTSQPSTGQQQ